jgi:TPR repeat protein
MSGFDNYADSLKNGEGIPQNLSEAVKYYKLSADLGNSTAMNNYADCLKNGQGIDQNFQKQLIIINSQQILVIQLQ